MCVVCSYLPCVQPCQTHCCCFGQHLTSLTPHPPCSNNHNSNHNSHDHRELHRNSLHEWLHKLKPMQLRLKPMQHRLKLMLMQGEGGRYLEESLLIEEGLSMRMFVPCICYLLSCSRSWVREEDTLVCGYACAHVMQDNHYKPFLKHFKCHNHKHNKRQSNKSHKEIH